MNTKLSFLFLIVSVLIQAQINPKTKWGNVSQAEIDYKEVPFEKDADAVILHESGEMLITYTEWGNKIHQRIKILSEKGKEEANFKIVYFTYRNRENILDFKAHTINFENGKKEISSVKMKDVYDVPYYGYYYARTFAFPNVKVGSIIELEYTLLNDNHNYLENWKFQHHLPTLYSSLKIDVQVPIDYVPICYGNKLLDFIKKNKNKKEYKTQWFLTDIPSFEKQDFIYNHSDYGEKIDFQLKGYHHKTKGYVTEVVRWTDINRMTLENNYTKNNETIVKNIASRISSENDEILQTKKVIEYISKNYKWNEETQSWMMQSLDEIENTRRGNSSELNFLLHKILNRKGINTQLVQISLRNHRKLQTAYPYFNQFSTLVNLITFKDGTSVFLDASYLPKIDYEFMPLRNYNHYGLILDDSKEKFVEVIPPVSEFISVQNYIFKDDKIALLNINKSNGYFNTEKLSIELDIQNTIDIPFLEKTQSSPTLIENKYKGIRTQSTAPIQSETFFSIQNPLRNIINQYKFEEIKRERALEFNFPIYYKISSSIKIPEGYQIEIPQNFNSKNEIRSKEIVFLQNAEIKDGNLIFLVELLMSKSTFINQYEEIKSFFEKSNLDASKTILLKKV